MEEIPQWEAVTPSQEEEGGHPGGGGGNPPGRGGNPFSGGGNRHFGTGGGGNLPGGGGNSPGGGGNSPGGGGNSFPGGGHLPHDLPSFPLGPPPGRGGDRSPGVGGGAYNAPELSQNRGEVDLQEYIPYGTNVPTIKAELKHKHLPSWDGNHGAAIEYFWKVQ